MRGGIAHYVALLYRKLTEKGHDVHVLSFRRQYPKFLFPGRTQADEGDPLIPVDSAPILDSIQPASWVKAFFWIRRKKPDLIVFKYWMPFFAPCFATVAFLSRQFLGVRVLYLLDNIIPHEKRIGDVFLSRLGLAFADAFIVQSKSVLADLLRFVPDAAYQEVPHPVYEIFPPKIGKGEARKKCGIHDERMILYFGYIRKYKGLPDLVRAMPLILKKVSLRLVICGEFYEGREETLGLIDSLNIGHAVTLVDRFIPNQEVGWYFCAADLVVLPYRSATQSGIVQVAYHYEKPVLITRVGGLPEVVPDGRAGFVVPPEDPGALAEAVIRFYREHREEAFAKGVKEEKKKYSWDRMVEAITRWP